MRGVAKQLELGERSNFTNWLLKNVRMTFEKSGRF